MPLQTVQPLRGCLGDKFCFQLFGWKIESDIHQRAGSNLGMPTVITALVDFCVQQCGLFPVNFLNGLDATDFLQPFQNLADNVNGETRRGIEHRSLVRVGFIGKHGGRILGSSVEEIFANDNDGHAGRP